MVITMSRSLTCRISRPMTSAINATVVVTGLVIAKRDTKATTAEEEEEEVVVVVEVEVEEVTPVEGALAHDLLADTGK